MPIDTSIYQMRPAAIDPMATMSGLLSMQQARQQLDSGRMELAAKQRAIDDDDAVRGAMAKWSKGNGKIDWDGAIGELESGGHGPSAFKLREAVTKQRKEAADQMKTSLENTQATLTLAGRVVRGMEAEIAERGISSAEEVFGRTKGYLSTLLTPELASQLGERYDPARIKSVLAWEKTAQESISEQKNLFDMLDRIRDDERQKGKDAPEIAEKWSDFAGKAFSLARSPEDWARIDKETFDQGLPASVRQMIPQDFSPEAVGVATALAMTPKERADVQGSKEQRAETKRHNVATEGLQRERLQMEKDDVTKLTPEGLDVVAKQFALTGNMPALGQGAKDLRAKVINRAAELFQGMDLATQGAAYAANKQSLSKLQVQSDALEAFESTALKNLEVFLNEAKKVADTGSPYFNKPVRALNEKLLGDPNMAAFNTARRVVVPEFARIIANPGLSGVLSDSARGEVEELLKGEATLKQIYRVAGILKTDAKARRDSMHEQIDAVTKRLTQMSGPGPAGGGKTVELIDSSGKTYQVPEADVDRALTEFKARGLRRK